MHLYVVQHYTQIFDGDLATWRLAEYTTLLSLYMRQGDPATRQPGDPDHATLAKHLYAFQHYTEIFDSATLRPGNPATWGLTEHTTLLSLYMRPGDPANPDHSPFNKHTILLSLYMRLGDPATRRPQIMQP